MEIGLKLKYILHFGEFLSNLDLEHSIINKRHLSQKLLLKKIFNELKSNVPTAYGLHLCCGISIFQIFP